MGSTNLDVTSVAASQSQKEVTINDGFEKLDAAHNSALQVEVDDSNAATIALASQQSYYEFELIDGSPVPDAAITINFSDDTYRRGAVLIINSTSFTATIQKDSTGTDTLGAGEARLFKLTAGGATAVTPTTSTAALAHDVGMFRVGGPPATSERMLQYVAGRAFTLPMNLTGSQGYAKTAPTSSFAVDIQKNGSSVGTATFGAASNTSTFTMASATSFTAGDRLELIAPGSADATAADISITLLGTRD